jgi:uncharacterized NAD(P)/FAD-binding protein YdhS
MGNVERCPAWLCSATELDPAAPVLPIGTGLTMVDAVVSLLDQGHHGPIHALSRRGLLPRRHLATPPPPETLQPYPTGRVDPLAIMRDLTLELASRSPGYAHAARTPTGGHEEKHPIIPPGRTSRRQSVAVLNQNLTGRTFHENLEYVRAFRPCH